MRMVNVCELYLLNKLHKKAFQLWFSKEAICNYLIPAVTEKV